MATAGTITVNIEGRLDGLQRSLTSARGMFSNFTTGIAQGIGQFAANQGFAALTRGFEILRSNVSKGFEDVDNLGKMSDRLGISTESLLAFEHAAKVSGVTMEDVEKSFAKLNREIGKAATGDKGDKKAFDALGLDPAKLAAMSPDEAFLATADAVNQLGSTYKRAAAVQDLFGRGGQKMLNFLGMGSAGIRASGEEVARFGGMFSRDQAASVEAANDALTRMEMIWDNIGRRIAIEVSPFIEVAAEHLLGSVDAAATFDAAIASIGDTAATSFGTIVDRIQEVKAGLMTIALFEQELRAKGDPFTGLKLSTFNEKVGGFFKSIGFGDPGEIDRSIEAAKRMEEAAKGKIPGMKEQIGGMDLLAGSKTVKQFQEDLKKKRWMRMLDFAESEFPGRKLGIDLEGMKSQQRMAATIAGQLAGQLGKEMAIPDFTGTVMGSQEELLAQTKFERGQLLGVGAQTTDEAIRAAVEMHTKQNERQAELTQKVLDVLRSINDAADEDFGGEA